MPEKAHDHQLPQLVDFPREDLNIELKAWLDLSAESDRANLAKAMLALANSGGGYILIGFTESQGQWVSSEERPESLDGYSQDAVNDIVRRYADPPFQCEVYHVRGHTAPDTFPVIVVPGNQRVPIRAKSEDPERKHVRVNAYYIRRPGPSSDQPQNAREWDDLIRRCILAAREELLEAFRHIMYSPVSGGPGGAEGDASAKLQRWERACRQRWESLVTAELTDEKPCRYEKGVWTAAYALVDSIQQPELTELLSVLRDVQGHETGWPPWWVPTRREIAPYPYEGVVECWMKESHFEDGAHSDFWRASPEGMLFLLRGYQEDSEGGFSPGTALVVTSPVWQVGQILLHLQRFAIAMNPTPLPAVVRFRWEGLANRMLASWRGKWYDLRHHKSRQSIVESEVRLTTDQIADSLPELVALGTKPLFQAFDFFTPPMRMIQSELSELSRRRV